MPTKANENYFQKSSENRSYTHPLDKDLLVNINFRTKSDQALMLWKLALHQSIADLRLGLI